MLLNAFAVDPLVFYLSKIYLTTFFIFRIKLIVYILYTSEIFYNINIYTRIKMRTT